MNLLRKEKYKQRPHKMLVKQLFDNLHDQPLSTTYHEQLASAKYDLNSSVFLWGRFPTSLYEAKPQEKSPANDWLHRQSPAYWCSYSQYINWMGNPILLKSSHADALGQCGLCWGVFLQGNFAIWRWSQGMGTFVSLHQGKPQSWQQIYSNTCQHKSEWIIVSWLIWEGG